METVYKVVTQADGGLWSVIHLFEQVRDLALQYEQGETTYPVFGKLIAFDDQECAIKYAKDLAEYYDFIQVWKASTSRISDTDILDLACLDTCPIEKYWAGILLNPIFEMMPAPLGTLTCDDITLVEQVIYDVEEN